MPRIKVTITGTLEVSDAELEDLDKGGPMLENRITEGVILTDPELVDYEFPTKDGD